MRLLLSFLSIIIILFACKKVDKPVEQPISEETIKFSTNLDTGKYNIVDTLPLTITISSKLPTNGVLLSITSTWTDSSRQIYKLDTSLNVTTINLNIPGHRKEGNYKIDIAIQSRSSNSNSSNKSMEFVNDPLKRFQGYKVDEVLRMQDEVNYWRDCGVVWDVIAYKFLVNLSGGKWNGFMPQLITGDFNKDGWIDIFNPGVGTFNGEVNDKFQWLIWNPKTFVFDNKNLLNDKGITTFGGNQRRTISADLNKDGYTDNIIIDHGDDINFSLPRQPIRIMLSDGKGGYDLKEIKISERLGFFHSGDLGDLNNDGLLDLVVVAGDQIIIAWGDKSSSYFGTIKLSYFDSFTPRDNGFGEWFPEIAGQSWNILINDINKDGWKDLIVGSNEDYSKSTYKFELTTKIVFNQGQGRFNKNGYTALPPNWRMKNATDKNNFLVNDFRVVDINNDGLNDIIATASFNYDTFSFFSYMQKSKDTFVIDTTLFEYSINSNRTSGNYGTSWKPWIIYYDFNNDGIKDISYIDPHNYWNNSLKRKSVFIRKGTRFIEQDFYQFDPYARSLK